MDLYFGQKRQFKTKMVALFIANMQHFTHKMLIDGLEWCGLLVDSCNVFISCFDSHSDGTHSLLRIHGEQVI